MNAPIDLNRLLPLWEQFSTAADVGPVRDEDHYDHMVDLLDSLLDAAGGTEDTVVMGLVDLIGDLIADYESARHPLPEASGVAALAFLMQQHGLRQSDLAEVGSQGVVSEILAGKRDLNLRQVRALSRRFGVAPATFL